MDKLQENNIQSGEDFDDICMIKKSVQYKRYLQRRLKEKHDDALAVLLNPMVCDPQMLYLAKREWIIRKEYLDMMDNDQALALDQIKQAPVKQY